MKMNSDNDKRDGNEKLDRELICKLFSAGFTILGIGFPIIAGALVALRRPEISTGFANGLKKLVFLLLPAVIICTAQSLLCLGTITGLINKPRLAIFTTFALIVYMMLSILVWALVAVLG